MRRSTRGVLAGLVIGGALFVAAASFRPSAEVREFWGAYPREVSPRGPIREFTLTAAPASVPLFDGRPLEVWAYNGQVPGPVLRVRLGETVRATLINRLPQPTTIHWHGVRLPNAMDGVPGVTQPAVQPGESFTYTFTPKDAGTFWFHPHLSASEQVERGLYGLLIVDDPQPPPYSRDLVWVLDDWMITPQREIFGEFNTRHDLMHDGRWGNVITVNGNEKEQLHLKAGERIRLRLLNVANGRIFAPDFTGLSVRVIAYDGLYAARPLDPDHLELAPGNRVDLDVTVPVAQRGRRVAVVDRFYPPRPNPLAEVIVDDQVEPTPSFASPAHAHVPRWSGAAALPARITYRLNARAGGRFGIEWTINDRAFDHGAHGGHDHPRTRLPYGEFSKLVFINDSFRLHPMHLHGQFWKVLSRNGVAVDEEHFRDTVLIHSKETVEVGLVPEEEGSWMMHCHILEHAESGMMALVDVRR